MTARRKAAARCAAPAAWAAAIVLALCGAATCVILRAAEAPVKSDGAKFNGEKSNAEKSNGARSAAPSEDIVEIMGSNAACCVCHMTFLKEDLAKSHLKAKVGCAKCHGTSAAHANDEHIGATKPDVVFKRHEIDPGCVKCHETHNAHAREVIARFVERKLPAGPQPTCTECHGMHRIDRALEAQLKSQK